MDRRLVSQSEPKLGFDYVFDVLTPREVDLRQHVETSSDCTCVYSFEGVCFKSRSRMGENC